jgi:thioredoxin 1
MTSLSIQKTTDATFEADVLQASGPVLVDFWATWCGPCKVVSKFLEEASVAYEGRVKIVKINIDDNRLTPASLGVRGVPTVLIYKDGELKSTTVGSITKAQLTALMDSQL